MSTYSVQYICDMYIDMYIQILHTNITLYIMSIRSSYNVFARRRDFGATMGVHFSVVALPALAVVAEKHLCPATGLMSFVRGSK